MGFFGPEQYESNTIDYNSEENSSQGEDPAREIPTRVRPDPDRAAHQGPGCDSFDQSGPNLRTT